MLAGQLTIVHVAGVSIRTATPRLTQRIPGVGIQIVSGHYGVVQDFTTLQILHYEQVCKHAELSRHFNVHAQARTVG
jgi:hypothetical protein